MMQKKPTETGDKLERTAYKGFRGAYHSSDALDLFKTSVDLANQSHSAVLSSLNTIANIVPPLRVAVYGVVGLWEILHAIYLDKISSVQTRAGRVGIATGIIAFGILAVAYPPLSAIALIGIAGLALGKELLNVTVAANDYLKIRKLYKAELDPVKKALFKKELQEQRSKIISKTVDAVLAVASVVGFALLIPPFTPVGGGIIIATAALGAAVKLGPPLLKRFWAVTAPLRSKLFSKFFKNEKSKEDSAQLGEQQEERIEKTHVEDSTADLSMRLSDDPREALKKGIEEAHEREPDQQQGPSHTWSKGLPAKEGGKQEEEGENESMDETPPR